MDNVKMKTMTNILFLFVLMLSSCAFVTSRKVEVKNGVQKDQIPKVWNVAYTTYNINNGRTIESIPISETTHYESKPHRKLSSDVILRSIKEVFDESGVNDTKFNSGTSSEFIKVRIDWFKPKTAASYYASLMTLFLIPYTASEKAEAIFSVYKKGVFVQKYRYRNRMHSTYSAFLVPLGPFLDSPNEKRKMIIKDFFRMFLKDYRKQKM